MRQITNNCNSLENKGVTTIEDSACHSKRHIPPSENVNNRQEFNTENPPDLPAEISRLNVIIDKLNSANTQLRYESDILAQGLINRNTIIAELTTELDALKTELAELIAESSALKAAINKSTLINSVANKTEGK